MVLDKLRATIKKYRLIDKGDHIVIGVSGGPDSAALLYLLNSLSEELKISLHIAHLDHMLRPDSYKDSKFVQGLADRLRLPVTVARINVGKLANKGCLEEIARNARLGFLFSVARKAKASKIALAHNLDDQAETVLMRLLRGSGLYGLSGILPRRKICGYEVIRPLIEVKRKEIEAYLKRKKIKPLIDISNSADIYLRNKIRNKLLPLLEKSYNNNIKEILAHTAETIGYDYDYLRQAAQKKADGFKRVIKIDEFLRLHPAIQRLVLRFFIGRLKKDLRRITFQHIREIEDLIYNRPLGSVVDLPGGICVVKKKNFLSFCLKKQQ